MPTGPIVGANDVIAGLGIMVNVPTLVVAPPGVDTVILPLVAPTGTTAVIPFGDTAETDVDCFPLNATLNMSARCLPVIVTFVPTGPETGENDVIVGGRAN